MEPVGRESADCRKAPTFHRDLAPMKRQSLVSVDPIPGALDHRSQRSPPSAAAARLLWA